ncbi:MAG: hypothetical protein KDI44_14955 [Thiothrix sp.]|nr:hypothetical protein [Thiothrix sp.]HPQ94996.1 hypothetical protein [Thiolinea sp.]
MKPIETLRGNFTEAQALQIRQEEHARGNYVNIRRLHSRLLEIEVIHGPRLQVLDVTPQRRLVRESVPACRTPVSGSA